MVPGSPTKRHYRPTSALAGSYSGNNSSANNSRPQSPLLRRPPSTLGLRSPTPTLGQMRRPGTPSSLSLLNPQSGYSSPQKDNVYSGNIKVTVRIKPALKATANITTSQDGSITNFNDTWNVDTDNQSISTKDIGEFNFDHVFHGAIENSRIFESSVSELVRQVVAGFNGTVFAYGMTGSGKTYSMQGSQDNPGIIPLSVSAIFNHIQSPSADPTRTYAVKVSYLEIYNEHLHDLLSPQTPSEDIKLRDDPARGVRAMGLKEVTVESPEELIECIQTGDALRRTEGTDYNAKSSRSHAVVQIAIESSPKRPGTIAPRVSTLYLCDLAGSERAASQSERRKEGAYINKSLLTLGTVIARLSVTSSGLNLGSSSAGHIPYRDSKLTRLLQPALSGKSLVSVLCTVDMCNASNNGETISTLRFAARAKNITLSAKRNEETSDPNAKLIEKLLSQVEQLKSENLQLRSGVVTGGGDGSASAVPSSPSNGLLMSQVAQLEAENRILHERVEHLTRLCDDDRLEDIIGLGLEDMSGKDTEFNGTSTPSRSSSVSSSASSEFKFQDSSWKRKESEYKSYVSHLEKQIYLLEVQKRSSSSLDVKSPEIPSSSMFPPVRSASSPQVVSPPTTTGNFPPNHYLELIADLKEEIEELKESNSDKDRIISTLRSINKRKENLTALSQTTATTSSPSPVKSGLPTRSVSPLLHSPAYSRYYFSPSSSSTNSNSVSSTSSLSTAPTPSLGTMSSTMMGDNNTFSPRVTVPPSASVASSEHHDDSTLTDIPVS